MSIKLEWLLLAAVIGLAVFFYTRPRTAPQSFYPLQPTTPPPGQNQDAQMATALGNAISTGLTGLGNFFSSFAGGDDPQSADPATGGAAVPSPAEAGFILPG